MFCSEIVRIFSVFHVVITKISFHTKFVVKHVTDASVSMNKSEERSEEHTSELQSRQHLVCRLLLEKKNNKHDHRRTRRPSLIDAIPPRTLHAALKTARVHRI